MHLMSDVRARRSRSSLMVLTAKLEGQKAHREIATMQNEENVVSIASACGALQKHMLKLKP